MTMLSVDTTLARLRPAAPVAPSDVPLAEAQGLVLAASLTAPDGWPPERIALRAGWAVVSVELVGASPYAPVRPATAPRPVDVGAPLPPGTDAVLPPTAWDGADLTLEAAPGEGTRARGTDAPAGVTLREVGRALGAPHLAIAAALGLRTVHVRRPRIQIGSHGGPAAMLLASRCIAAGAQVETVQGVPNPGGAEADVVLLVLRSQAERDALLSAFATDLVADGIALRPGGEDMLAGRIRGCPVLAFPNRIEAALAADLALVAPLIAALTGGRDASEPAGEGRLTRKLVSRIGLAELALLRCGDRGILDPLGVGDLTLSAIAAADRWLLLPPESEGVPAGEMVRVRRF